MRRILFVILLVFVLSGGIVLTAAADEAAPAETTQAGQTAEYHVELRNDTAVSHDYTLSISGLPENLTTSFTQGGPVLQQVTVATGGYGQVTLRVEVPLDTPVGRYPAIFTATRDDGATLTLPVALNVENTYSVRITSQAVNVNTFSGQEFTFEATASNTGAAPLTNLALVINAPAKWVVQTEPQSVASLEPGAAATYSVRVFVPASQIPIDQLMSLSATSDQAASPETTLTVRVQSSPNYLIFAGVISLLAVAGVLVYFRVRGRR